MGDFNLNLLNYHSHQFTGEFLDIMYSNVFFFDNSAHAYNIQHSNINW
jgi:hypothetical protein